MCWAFKELDALSAELPLPLIDKGIEYARTLMLLPMLT
jgi:hypothetical protein